MRGIRAWARLLGLARAVVEDVFLDGEAVVVCVRPRARERDRCAICRRRCPGYDWGEGRRRWRALDLGTTKAYVEAEAPRVACKRHGVIVAAVPWARHDSWFTTAFEDQCAWLAVNTSASAVAALMRTTWRAVGGICARVADEARARRDLSRLYSNVFEATAGAERVIELLDAQPRVVERPGAIELGRARGRLELSGVRWTYPGGCAALDGFDLVVVPGRTVALVGVSGSGKSTVAKLAVRFLDPDAGSVHLDDHDVRDLTLASLRRNVGVLLQYMHRRELLHLDVKPSNIIASAGRAILIDLSLARPSGRCTAGTGTWCNLAPSRRAVTSSQRPRMSGAWARCSTRPRPAGPRSRTT